MNENFLFCTIKLTHQYIECFLEVITNGRLTIVALKSIYCIGANESKTLTRNPLFLERLFVKERKESKITISFLCIFIFSLSLHYYTINKFVSILKQMDAFLSKLCTVGGVCKSK